jgi:hypothetical protein
VLVTLRVLYRFDFRRLGEDEEPVRFPSPDE